MVQPGKSDQSPKSEDRNSPSSAPILETEEVEMGHCKTFTTPGKKATGALGACIGIIVHYQLSESADVAHFSDPERGAKERPKFDELLARIALAADKKSLKCAVAGGDILGDPELCKCYEDPEREERDRREFVLSELQDAGLEESQIAIHWGQGSEASELSIELPTGPIVPSKLTFDEVGLLGLLGPANANAASAGDEGVSQSAPAVTQAPYDQLVLMGHHTPGFCLDRVIMKVGHEFNSSRLAATVFDGMTNDGADILRGHKNGPESIDDLSSGFVVSRLPELLIQNFEEHYAARPRQIHFTPPKLQRSDCATVSTLAAWLSSGEKDGVRYALMNNANLLTQGLGFRDNLFLNSQGLKLGTLNDSNNHVCTINASDSLPPGIRAGRYLKFWSGDFNQQRLENDTYRFLSKKSPDEIAHLIFDVPKLPVALALSDSMDDSLVSLVEPFRQKFEFLHRQLSGGVVLAGVIRLGNGQGAALFSIGNCVVGTARDGKIAKCLQPDTSYEHLSIRIFYDGSICPIQSANLKVTLIPEDEMRQSIFFGFSDGWFFPEENLHQFLNLLKGHFQSARGLVARAQHVVNQVDDIVGINVKNLCQTDYNADDRSFFAVEGLAL